MEVPEMIILKLCFCPNITLLLLEWLVYRVQGWPVLVHPGPFVG